MHLGRGELHTAMNCVCYTRPPSSAVGFGSRQLLLMSPREEECYQRGDRLDLGSGWEPCPRLGWAGLGLTPPYLTSRQLLALSPREDEPYQRQDRLRRGPGSEA